MTKCTDCKEEIITPSIAFGKLCQFCGIIRLGKILNETRQLNEDIKRLSRRENENQKMS